MAENKIQMPSGMGGLIRYSDQATSKIQFRPGLIIVFIILIILIEVLLHTYGQAWFG